MPPKPLDGHWYFHVHGETFGPLTTEVVSILLRQYRLQFTDWAWCESLTRWTRVAEIEQFTAYLPQYPDAPIPTPQRAPVGLPPLGAQRPLPFAPLTRPPQPLQQPMPQPMAPQFAGNAATATAQPMMAPPTPAPMAPPHLEVVPPPPMAPQFATPQAPAPAAQWPQPPPAAPQTFAPPQTFQAPPPPAAPAPVMDLTAPAPAAAPVQPPPPAPAAPAPQAAAAPAPAPARPQAPPPPPPSEGDAEGDANQKAWIRRHTRVRLEGSVSIDGYGVFNTFDCSEGGLFIVANTPIPFGTDVKMRVESTAFPKPMDMTGIVIREGLSEAGEAGFAIQFTRVNPAHRRLVQDYVKQKLGQ